MADSTLAAIRKKVRLLTRSPSSSQLTNADIDEYVNTFILYDFPEHLRLFTMRTTFTFFTEAFIDTYVPETIDSTAPLYNFANKYISFHKPVFIAGENATLSQDRTEFYNAYPLNNSIVDIASGDGVTVVFAGTLANIPILRDQVLFSSYTTTYTRLAVNDDGSGNLVGDGSGTIDYNTGVYSVTFDSAPKSGVDITAQTLPYVPSRPRSVLYYDNTFFLRPVPDQSYRVDMDAYLRPTEMLSAGASPDLEQWWQYIAYGAAKKVFEDRSDIDSIAQILPEYKTQEMLVLRRTIVTQTKERVATIYNQQSGLGGGFGNSFS